MYERIRRWYQQGLWSARMVDQAAEKGVITETQANKIKKEVNTDGGQSS